MLFKLSSSTEVRKMFEKLEKKAAKQALKQALNETANRARELLAQKAQNTYTIKKAGFNKAMKIKKATIERPVAIISSRGAPIPIKQFKISQGKDGAKAQIIKSGSLKLLQKGNIKAFVNNVANKSQTRKRSTSKGSKGSSVRHFAVAQRKGARRLPIKTLFGNSIPVMIGSQQKVYNIVEPEIGENLRIYLHRFIEQALGG